MMAPPAPIVSVPRGQSASCVTRPGEPFGLCDTAHRTIKGGKYPRWTTRVRTTAACSARPARQPAPPRPPVRHPPAPELIGQPVRALAHLLLDGVEIALAP